MRRRCAIAPKTKAKPMPPTRVAMSGDASCMCSCLQSAMRLPTHGIAQRTGNLEQTREHGAAVVRLRADFEFRLDLESELVPDAATDDFHLPRTLSGKPLFHGCRIDDRLRVRRRCLSSRAVGEVPKAVVVDRLVIDDLGFELPCLQAGIEHLI